MQEDILEKLNGKTISNQEIKKELSELNEVDIAELFQELKKERVIQIFRLLPKNKAADVFSYIEPEEQRLIIESITDSEVRHIVDDLYFDDTVDFLEEMPANVVKKVLKNTNEDMRKLINHYLNYPDDTAGSVMTIEYIDLKKNMTVKSAIERIRKLVDDKETFNMCYVTDNQRILEGVISIKTLLLSKDEQTIEELMDKNIIYVQTTDDCEFVSNVFMKYDYSSLAVVDREKRLVGIITIDDVVDIIQDENTEDFEIMAAMTPSEKPYLKTGVIRLALNRIPWLLFLMLSATLTGLVINSFEQQLASQIVLISFIPMLMNTGGNSGSQSATLVIRGLALGEIKLKDFFKIMRKELVVGIIAGFSLAVFNFARLLLFGEESVVALVVCSSIFLAVIIANIIGGILPLIAKFFKLDPALMASPLISTIVDVVSLIAYFQVARLILHI